jgi:hypothetical protein
LSLKGDITKKYPTFLEKFPVSSHSTKQEIYAHLFELKGKSDEEIRWYIDRLKTVKGLDFATESSLAIEDLLYLDECEDRIKYARKNATELRLISRNVRSILAHSYFKQISYYAHKIDFMISAQLKELREPWFNRFR